MRHRKPTRRAFLAGAAGALSAAAAAPAAGQPLYLLTYDHGGLVLWGMDHFAERLRDAVAWLDRYPGFKIGLDNEAYTYDYLAEHDPKMLAELNRLLERYAGRFGIGTCTYGQPLSTFINEESNIRQIEYALDADRRHFRRAPETYLMSEHAMHSQLPQILSGFGFRTAIMRTHFMMYGYNPTYDAAVGWWTGPDGSRIATVPTYTGEGAEFGKTTTDNWILTRCPGPECRGNSIEEFRSRYAHLSPAIATRADDSGLRREALVKETEGRAEYRWILLEEIPKLLPAPAAVFQTGPNDYPVRMPWGYCGNEIWNQNRKAEVAAATAERLAAVELLTGGANREAELEKAWKNLLVAQHHDIQICGLLPEARKFLGLSLEASERAATASMAHTAGRMQGGAAAQVTVFNSQSWPRAEWVEATVALPRRFARAVEARHGDRVVPSVLLSALRASDESVQEARIAIRAEAPALGFASYSIAPAGTAPAAAAAEPYWEVRPGPRGGIASVTDRKSGAAVIRDARFAATIDGKVCESEGTWRILPSPAGAGWTTAREEGSIAGIPYRMEVTSWPDSPRIDVRAEFEYANQKIGTLSENKRDARSPFIHEAKLRFKFFPQAGERVTGVRDLPFVVAETDAPYVQGNYWTAVAGSRGGTAVFNRGVMCSVREADGGVSIPLAYSMYYIWGTRILSGKYTYEFALYPFSGPWAAAGLHRRALEYNYPFRVLGSRPGSGAAGNRVALFEVESEHVIASALFPKGGKACLRMYEHAGRPGEARLRYAAGRGRLIETDLAGKAGRPAGPAVAFRPWQIRTFQFEV